LKNQQLVKIMPPQPTMSIALVEDDELLRAEVS